MNRWAHTLTAGMGFLMLIACGLLPGRSHETADPTAIMRTPASEVSGTAGNPVAQSSDVVEPGVSVPTKLSCRAMVRDGNRNHVLEEGERISVEVDVHNEGPAPVHGVEVHLTGTRELTDQFTSPLRIGDLPAGEHRRVSVAATVPKLDHTQEAEVTLSIRASGPAVEMARPKKFLMAVRPVLEELEVLSVSVDQPPRRVQGYEQSDAVAVVIGIGAFRDATLAFSRFAVRDAKVMAGYFAQTSGIPVSQVKVVTDGQALRDDFVTVFESWLPQHAKPRGTVYVYFAGRAVVEPETGAVSLVPYDGKPNAQQRLYSLARLHAALARLPIERAILLLEVSLDPTGGIPVAQPLPRWDPDASEVPHGKIIQMIGNTAIQDAHDYQPGQHGLFTYYVLKGLRGEADSKKSGQVLLRDLCRYVQVQVRQVAQTEYGNRQAPICRPTPSAILELEHAPLARLR